MSTVTGKHEVQAMQAEQHTVYVAVYVHHRPSSATNTQIGSCAAALYLLLALLQGVLKCPQHQACSHVPGPCSDRPGVCRAQEQVADVINQHIAGIFGHPATG